MQQWDNYSNNNDDDDTYYTYYDYDYDYDYDNDCGIVLCSIYVCVFWF